MFQSFFGRTYNNLSSVSECKNNGECVINKKNRTSCKACRLRKCLLVGMSKSGSRYGRRSNWFKIHCLLQEQLQQQQNQQQHPHQQTQLNIDVVDKKPWEYAKNAATLLDIDNNNMPNDHVKSQSPSFFPISQGLVKAPDSPSFLSSRSTPLTVPHQPSLPYFISPFLQNSLHPITHNYLLPFLPIRPPLPLDPLVLNSPSPSLFHSSPTSTMTTPKKDAVSDGEADKLLEELRSLGPVQDHPIDLSWMKAEDTSEDVEKKLNSTNLLSKYLKSECEDKQSEKSESQMTSTIPLDLRCSKS